MRVSAIVKLWLVIGVFIALLESVQGVSLVDAEYLATNVSWMSFYYILSYKDDAVVIILCYLIATLPYMVFVVARHYLVTKKAFRREELLASSVFVAFWFVMIFFPTVLLGNPGTKWGRTFEFLIKSGWIGASVEFYFIFGCALYGAAVIFSYLIRRLLLTNNIDLR